MFESGDLKQGDTVIRILYLVAACMFAWPAVVAANPVGSYSVAGENPEDSTRYDGTVSIERYGQVYNVFWNIGGEEFRGTGIGAATVNGEMMFSSATSNDTAISISFVSEKKIGVALFIKQENGQWKGIWNYGESQLIGTETWSPR